MEDKAPIGTGHPGFHAILDKMRDIHNRKSTDYGASGDPFANYRSEEFGVPAWINSLLRGKDKWQRIITFCKKRKLANETFEDALLDMANQLVIAAVLFKEETTAQQ